jgi:hypothetical protein
MTLMLETLARCKSMPQKTARKKAPKRGKEGAVRAAL